MFGKALVTTDLFVTYLSLSANVVVINMNAGVAEMRAVLTSSLSFFLPLATQSGFSHARNKHTAQVPCQFHKWFLQAAVSNKTVYIEHVVVVSLETNKKKVVQKKYRGYKTTNTTDL